MTEIHTSFVLSAMERHGMMNWYGMVWCDCIPCCWGTVWLRHNGGKGPGDTVFLLRLLCFICICTSVFDGSTMEVMGQVLLVSWSSQRVAATAQTWRHLLQVDNCSQAQCRCADVQTSTNTDVQMQYTNTNNCTSLKQVRVYGLKCIKLYSFTLVIISCL